jgi:pimeloyl-ACP methyl ester carboxylesterase
MKTFMLIHGSWHSAWNWHRVVPLLRQQGHRAIAINLPSIGRDKTPISEVTFKTTVKKFTSRVIVLKAK